MSKEGRCVGAKVRPGAGALDCKLEQTCAIAVLKSVIGKKQRQRHAARGGHFFPDRQQKAVTSSSSAEAITA